MPLRMRIRWRLRGTSSSAGKGIPSSSLRLRRTLPTLVRKKSSKRKGTKVVRKGKRAYVCKPVKGSKAKFKKCILSAIRGTKITTKKGAQKAFRAAAKKCGALLAGAPRRKGGRKKGRKSTRMSRALARAGGYSGWRAPSMRGTRAQIRAAQRRGIPL